MAHNPGHGIAQSLLGGVEQGLALGQAFRQGSQRRDTTRLLGEIKGMSLDELAQNPSFAQLQQSNPQVAAQVAQQAKTFGDFEGEREKSLFQDTRSAIKFIEADDFEGTANFLGERLTEIERLRGDPSDTLGLATLLGTGKKEEALRQLRQIETIGINRKVLDPIKPVLSAAEIAAKKTTPEITNFSKLQVLKRTGTPEQVDSFSKLLGLTKDRKLSASAEKAIIGSQDSFFKSGQQARKMEVLIDDISQLNISGGLASTFSETLKLALGSQEEVTSARKRFNGIRASQAVVNLPPGVASDKDIALALSGFPAENANAEQITSFLRGQAKLERVNEKFHEFRANHISDNNTVKNLIPEWKKSLEDPAFLSEIITPTDPLKQVVGQQAAPQTTQPIGKTSKGRDISEEDIVLTLKNNPGLTREQLLQNIGVQ